MTVALRACIDGKEVYVVTGRTKVLHKELDKGVGVIQQVYGDYIEVSWNGHFMYDRYSRYNNKVLKLFGLTPSTATPSSFGLNERAHISLAAGQKIGPWVIIAENGACSPAPRKAYPTEEDAYAVANIMAEKHRKRFYVCHIRGYAEPAANVRTERF